MSNESKHNTPLDAQLRELALTDWDAFVQLLGEDAITKAKVCLLLNKGQSYNQVANKLQITKHQVEYMCNRKCQNLSDRNT
ncbi:MAG TPA: hypothetical protein PLU07_10505 [Ferruginibacter sp.]|nr:hypothetical protein [Ferruginibacter sp.]